MSAPRDRVVQVGRFGDPDGLVLPAPSAKRCSCSAGLPTSLGTSDPNDGMPEGRVSSHLLATPSDRKHERGSPADSFFVEGYRP
jgi:hypothetical protein